MRATFSVPKPEEEMYSEKWNLFFSFEFMKTWCLKFFPCIYLIIFSDQNIVLTWKRKYNRTIYWRETGFGQIFRLFLHFAIFFLLFSEKKCVCIDLWCDAIHLMTQRFIVYLDNWKSEWFSPNFLKFSTFFPEEIIESSLRHFEGNR